MAKFTVQTELVTSADVDTILSANERRIGGIIYNHGPNTVHVNFGADPTAGSVAIGIPNGGSWNMKLGDRPVQDDIRTTCAGGQTAQIAYVEVT